MVLSSHSHCSLVYLAATDRVVKPGDETEEKGERQIKKHGNTQPNRETKIKEKKVEEGDGGGRSTNARAASRVGAPN